MLTQVVRMATSNFWERATAVNVEELQASSGNARSRGSQQSTQLGMLLDALTVLCSVMIAILYRFRISPVEGLRSLIDGSLIHGRSLGVLLALFCVFTLALIVISRRHNLYKPTRLPNFLLEQRLSVQHV
ncbi:MAG: hypothetical protein KGN79_08550 [Acidobacteriota bacterium]|nr:hypothetical protein [Acidobacteriota bacterium]